LQASLQISFWIQTVSLGVRSVLSWIYFSIYWKLDENQRSHGKQPGSASRFDNHMRITTFEIADNNKVFEFGEIDQYYES